MSQSSPPPVSEVDAFDLPEWLASSEVTWSAESSVRARHLVTGSLISSAERTACDLLAADVAFPRPMLDQPWRQSVHQAWTHGQVLLLEYGGRLTLSVPGTEFTADLVLEAIARLAKAIGVSPSQFVVALRL